MPAHPLDAVEKMAVDNQWPYERPDPDEVIIVVRGKHTDYRVSYTWMESLGIIHLACGFEMVVAATHRVSETIKLILKLNSVGWYGHFEWWADDRLVMYRAQQLVDGENPFSSGVSERMLDSAVSACEAYYPAFQFVIWSGKTAEEAFDAVQFETKGEA